ncbi:PREDICTED: uncharacterized protein LOC106110529 [Papilio polytes]|uniref:uncharacterized protein LOC106110529 n=1 Tax=Papilio polytes TaxID=76194 RepID=UPI000675C578|nr:PREDICTED: uncharacterized protein LOC106110529 [Papilio polytes]
MHQKTWNNRACQQRYIDRMSMNLIIFQKLTNMMPLCMQNFIDTLSFNEANGIPPEDCIMLGMPRLREIRERALMAAGTYRNARDQPQAINDLPRYCYWEIMWANASAQQFLATMSAPRSRPLLPSTYIRNVPYYEIQKCQLMVTKIELFSLWLIVCSLSRETQSLKFLLRLIREEMSKIRNETKVRRRRHEENGLSTLCLLKGHCFASLNLPEEAIKCFKRVAGLKTKRSMDKYLISYAMIESAMCHYNIGMVDVSHHLLNVARTTYSNGTPEFRALGHAYSKAMVVRLNESE